MQNPNPNGLPGQGGPEYAEPKLAKLGVARPDSTFSVKQQNHKIGNTKENQLNRHDPGTWPSKQSIPIIASRQNPHDFPPKPNTHRFMPSLLKSGNESPRPPP